MKRLIFSLFVLTTISFATVTVDGYAYLENQSDHSGINVIFKLHDTGTVSDSVTTEENGYFTVQVETNNYFITYEKDGFFSEDIKPRGTIEFDANTTLSSITLLKQTKLIKFANFIENTIVDNYQKLNFPQKILEKIQLADSTSQTAPVRHHQSDTSQPPASEPATRFSKNAAPPEMTGEAGASDQPRASNLATRFSKNTASSDTSDKAGASDQPPASNLATRFSKNVASSDISDKAGASDQPANATSQSPTSESVIRFSKNTAPPEMTEKAGSSDQPPASNLATRFSKNVASSDTSDKAGVSDQPLASNPATRFSKNAVPPGAPGKTGPDPQQTITTKYRSTRKPPAKTKMGAMTRSLLFPGLGQFYANQRMWGYGWIAAEVVAGGLIVMNYSNYKTAYDDYNDYHTSYANATDPVLIAHYKTQSQNSHDEIESAMDDMKTMASIAGVVWIANVVHAYMVGPKSEVTAYNEIPLQLAYDQNTDQFKLSVSIPLD